MSDNIDIAVLTKVNDLAERRGLKPYDFVATFRWDNTDNLHMLSFEVPASGNALRVERFEKMLRDLGVSQGFELKGTPNTIVDALDHALSLSPKPRSLF